MDRGYQPEYRSVVELLTIELHGSPGSIPGPVIISLYLYRCYMLIPPFLLQYM